jgi:hypothetical protein
VGIKENRMSRCAIGIWVSGLRLEDRKLLFFGSGESRGSITISETPWKGMFIR